MRRPLAKSASWALLFPVHCCGGRPCRPTLVAHHAPLGMVLWEMLALRTPFQHLSPQQIIAGPRLPRLPALALWVALVAGCPLPSLSRTFHPARCKREELQVPWNSQQLDGGMTPASLTTPCILSGKLVVALLPVCWVLSGRREAGTPAHDVSHRQVNSTANLT